MESIFKHTLFLTEHKVVWVAADSLIILNFCWYTKQIYFDLWFQEFALTYLIEIRSPLDFKSYALLSRWVLTLDLQKRFCFSHPPLRVFGFDSNLLRSLIASTNAQVQACQLAIESPFDFKSCALLSRWVLTMDLQKRFCFSVTFKYYALLSPWVLTLDLQIRIWFSVAFKNGGSEGLISNPPICWRRSILVIAKFVFAMGSHAGFANSNLVQRGFQKQWLRRPDFQFSDLLATVDTCHRQICFRGFNGRLGVTHLLFVEKNFTTKRLGFGVPQTAHPPIRISQSLRWQKASTIWESRKEVD